MPKQIPNNPPSAMIVALADVFAFIDERRRQKEGAFTGSDSTPDSVNAPDTTTANESQSDGGNCNVIIEH